MPRPRWVRLPPTLRYLAQTEAHVYALAISASVLLAFFPFCLVMVGLCRNILHWKAAERAIYIGIGDFFAGSAGQYIAQKLQNWFKVYKIQTTSLALLLITANGIFEPLEVALNRAWGVAENRSYLKNQIVSSVLIFACGCLALLSLMFTALNSRWLAEAGMNNKLAAWANLLVFKAAAIPFSIFALFLVYWLLPNRKVDPGRVLPVAIFVGLALEALKYVNLLVWPLLKTKLEREYEIFQYSVTILIWSFAAAMIVVGGAHWTARHEKADPLS